jgi:hypothetical protein
MSEPPSPESGTVVDPDVLATRRARRAEVSEDATLELKLFEAERRLGEVAAERDALREQIAGFERDLRGTRQREWAEQQQRLEAQGEAAATRELAGHQLAELRERLAEAEAELATVAAERDRARKAIEDERLRTTAERERREALEREGVVLRAELARRVELTTAAAEAVERAQHELQAGRVAGADAASLHSRIAAERRAFADRVVGVERAVASVRERLGTAAGVLRERVEAERSARVAAEAALVGERARAAAAEGQVTSLSVERDAAVRARDASAGAVAGERARAAAAEARAVDLERERTAVAQELAVARTRAAELERELAQRIAIEAQLRGALEGLTAELAALRADEGGRAAQLAERVESVVALASGLRGELGAEHEALSASLTAMQVRMAELEEELAAADGLRHELEAERAARWVAEAELDAERRRGDEDRAARATAESRLADAEAELEDLRAVARPGIGPDPDAVASLREVLARQPRTPAADAMGPVRDSLGADLTAAAERLRAVAGAEAEEEIQDEAEAQDEVLDREEDLEADASPVEEVLEVEDAREGAYGPEFEEIEDVLEVEEIEEEVVDVLAVEEAVEVEDHVGPEDVLEVQDVREAGDLPEPGPDLDTLSAPAVLRSGRQPVPARPSIIESGPWLRDALLSLAADEPEIAELLIVALLPAQGGLVNKPLTYELAITDGTTHRVVLDLEHARVELPSEAPVEARISGSLAALVPLVAGGAARRLPATQIEGRRRLRRLLKARRTPLGLAELAAAEVVPSPGLLLTVLARAVPASWTQQHPPLTVDIASAGSDCWRVTSSGGPLTILPADGAPPADAVLHTSANRLPAVLAGAATLGDAYVEGDVDAVKTLLSWLDRAQRPAR